MKLDKMVMANSAAGTAIVLWILCSIFVAIFPDLTASIRDWWMHGADGISTPVVSFASVVYGGISLTIAVWITIYVFAAIWEKMSQKG